MLLRCLLVDCWLLNPPHPPPVCSSSFCPLQLLIKTKEDAEAFLGPSDTLDASPTCYGLVHRKQRAGADPNNYYLSLPIELLFNPQRPGETDLLHMHCHMFKMHLANMLWDTRTVIGPIQQ